MCGRTCNLLPLVRYNKVSIRARTAVTERSVGISRSHKVVNDQPTPLDVNHFPLCLSLFRVLIPRLGSVSALVARAQAES